MHTRWASLVLALFLNVVLWSGGGVGRNLPAARTSTGTEPRPSLPLPPWLNTPEEAAAAAAAAVGGSIGRQGPPGDDNSTAEAAPRQPPPPWLADEPEEERAEGGGRGRRGLPSYKFPSKLGKAAERPPRYVFRGVHEDLPPERVMQQGGLLPNVADPRTLSPNSYQLLYHLEDGHGEESAYVSTSTSFEVAASYARPGGYVYVVKTTPNMVPIEYSIDRYFTRWEREYAALGGLQDGQIVDCLQMPAAGADWDVEELVPFFWDEGEDVSLNTLQPKRLLKDGLVEARREHLRYDHVRFEPMSASPGQPQLAGFAPTSGLWNKAALKRFDRHRPAWQHARDFMEAIGTPDGWSPRFPLFHCWWQEAGAERDNDVAAGELAGSSRISSGPMEPEPAVAGPSWDTASGGLPPEVAALAEQQREADELEMAVEIPGVEAEWTHVDAVEVGAGGRKGEAAVTVSQAPAEVPSLGSLAADLSPARPFMELVEAVRSDEHVPFWRWVGILGEIGLEVLAWTPTPFAPAARAARILSIGRTGYRLSLHIRRALNEGGERIAAKPAAQHARRVAEALDRRLADMHVAVPPAPKMVPKEHPHPVKPPTVDVGVQAGPETAPKQYHPPEEHQHQPLQHGEHREQAEASIPVRRPGAIPKQHPPQQHQQQPHQHEEVQAQHQHQQHEEHREQVEASVPARRPAAGPKQHPHHEQEQREQQPRRQSVIEIVRTADRVPVPKSMPHAADHEYEALLQTLDKLEVMTDEPVVPVMAHVVRQVKAKAKAKAKSPSPETNVVARRDVDGGGGAAGAGGVATTTGGEEARRTGGGEAKRTGEAQTGGRTHRVSKAAFRTPDRLADLLHAWSAGRSMGYHAPAWFLDELVDGIGAYLARGDCARTRDARCAYETFLAHNGLWGALVAHVAAAEEAPRAVRVP